MRRLSVVIPNFNYAEFVGQAISSALGIRGVDVEVIVVDDGSTDDSRARIESFGSAITAVFQENAGPREACNAGFALSSGDAVIFLDSDDMLEPDLAEVVKGVWRDGISKVQFPMTRIDRTGTPVGSVFPEYRRAPTSEQIRSWMLATGAYPTPPGSGNVYARSFLEQLFPLGDECGDATDSACLAAAPYLGDVVTVTRPLARYRLHGDNRSHLLVAESRFTRQLARAYARHVYSLRIAGLGTAEAARRQNALFRGRHLLQLRVAGYRLLPRDRPIPNDSPLRMLADAVRSPLDPGPESAVYRVLASGWSILTLVAPGPLARWLIQRRFRQRVQTPAPPRGAIPAEA